MPHAGSYDVIFIGSGAGGGTLAHKLAPSGKSILLLERGEHLPRESTNWSPEALFKQGAYKTKEQWVDKDGEPFAPSTYYRAGGNSNWRGPVWFPVNYLMIESLQKFDHYYEENFKVQMPNAGEKVPLWGVAANLSRRLIGLFRNDENGNRPVFGGNDLLQNDPNWDYPLFYEYFHGDNGAGIGASHQTGWTALVAKLIQQSGGPGSSPDDEPSAKSNRETVNTPKPVSSG
jgi:choline dehydrogenase-like flavoprotein